MIRAAASTTWAPKRSPGRRVSRSTGPLTLTAATTVASPARTGALTDATPASRSSTLATQPARTELARQHAARRSEVERQPRAVGHDPAQGVR